MAVMPRVEVPGATLYYEAEGEGPAVVFAHGAGGNRMSWWQQAPEFARDHRVIRFDHRSFGRSRCEPGAFDPITGSLRINRDRPIEQLRSAARTCSIGPMCTCVTPYRPLP